MIEAKNPDGAFGNFVQRFNDCSGQFEMIRPRVNARIEETKNILRPRQNGSQVGAFLPITEHACEREILHDSPAPMLDADNVIDLEVEKTVLLVNEAVFAKMIRPMCHLCSQRLIIEVAHRQGAGGRALWPGA